MEQCVLAVRFPFVNVVDRDTKNLIVNGDDKYLRELKCYKCGINTNNDLIAYHNL